MMARVRTVFDMLAALKALPPETLMVLDLGDGSGFVGAAVEVDEGSGVRIVLDPKDHDAVEAQKFIRAAAQLVDHLGKL